MGKASGPDGLQPARGLKANPNLGWRGCEIDNAEYEEKNRFILPCCRDN